MYRQNFKKVFALVKFFYLENTVLIVCYVKKQSPTMKKTPQTGIENGINKNNFQVYTVIFFCKDLDKCIFKHTKTYLQLTDIS